MSDKAVSSGGGVGICGLLTVVFVTAKVFGFEPVASWTWMWVFSPLWVGALIIIAAVVLFLVGAFIYYAFFDKPKRRLR